MNLRYAVERLRAIKLRWKGKGNFDYNTMFKVKQDAEEALKLVEAYGGSRDCIREFKMAISLADSDSKEEDRTKRDAIGALEHGIELFFGEG